MTTQPEFKLDEIQPDDPNIARLEKLLADGRWHLSGELIIAFFTSWGERLDGARINRLGAAAAPRVISGSHGYKLAAHATPEELNHFCNQMTSRGRAMIERADQTRRFAHRIVG